MHFDGRKNGERPYCLLDFFAASAKQFHGNPEKYLVIMDESHVTLPQVGGMYPGDKSRKDNLITHGFRLPSAADNRPLLIKEFQELVPRLLYVSATPGERELRHLCEVTEQPIPIGLQHHKGGGGVNEPELAKKSPDAESMYDMLSSIENIARMEIRPTGLLDPSIDVRPTEGQIADLLSEINLRIKSDERTLVTVLTIRFAEEVAEYLNKMGVKAHYLHSGIDTIERTEIINALRIGHIDVIVGINLLREGLDIPEVGLVAIFDADKEGFLRNERSLLQTIGRASRNENGSVILYSNNMGRAMTAAIRQTLERRKMQEAYNLEHGIIPKTILKAKPKMGADPLETIAGSAGGKRLIAARGGRKDGILPSNLSVGAGKWTHTENVVSNIGQPVEESILSIEELEKEMKRAAKDLDFERAAMFRDRIFQMNLDRPTGD